jgi:hypothetical protein
VLREVGVEREGGNWRGKVRSGEGRWELERESEKWRGKVGRPERRERLRGSGNKGGKREGLRRKWEEREGGMWSGKWNKEGNMEIDREMDKVEGGSHLSYLSVSVSAAFPFQTLAATCVCARLCVHESQRE